ncbi:MAG: hypothetical protein ACODAD_09770 [Planctomycetota bacterium]
MRTLFQSIGRHDCSSRTPDDTSAGETYGGENLPVLLRLPALSSPAVGPPSCVASGPSGPDEAPADTPVGPGAERNEAAAASAAASASGSGRPPRDSSASVAERGRERRQRRQRHSRREQATAGSRQPRAVSGWVRGTGQFAFAAVLAAMLLAAIVAFKGRDAEVESEPRWVDKQPSVDASESDVDQSGWERAAEATEIRGSDLLRQTAAGQAAAAKRERAASSTTSTKSTNEGMDRGLIGYGDEPASTGPEPSGGHDAGMGPYPTTDVDPVASTRREGETHNTAKRNAEGRETPPGNSVRNPVRSAERRSQPEFERRR